MIRKILHYLRDHPVIREYGDDELLTSAGFEWNEPVLWIFQIFGTTGLALFFYLLACLGDRRTPAECTAAVCIALMACMAACVLLGSIRRGLAFERDGRVTIRGGWVNRLELLFGGVKDHAQIASIEVTKTEEGSGVVIFTTYGGTMMLSHGLSEPAARLAAVQLTMALREMRECLTSIQNFQQPHARMQQTKAQAWVD